MNGLTSHVLRPLRVAGLIVSVLALALALLVVIVSMFNTRVWWMDLPSQFRWHFFLLFASAGTACVGLLLLESLRGQRRPVQTPPVSCRRAWRCAVAGLACVGSVIAGYSVLFASAPGLSPFEEGGSGENVLRVVHFNLGTRDGDWQNVLAWLEQQPADVMFLQEARPEFERELNASPLAKYVVLRNVRPDSRGTIALVLGEAQLLETHLDVTTFEQTGRQLASVTIRKNGDARTLLSIHMCRPLDPREFDKQSYEIERLGEWFAANPQGIALGDINCGPYSPRLVNVLRQGKLRASTAGTWPTPLPSWFQIPTDACVVDRFSDLQTRAGPDLGSDHRPLIATIRLPS